MRGPILRQIDLPNALTLSGLAAGAGSAFFAIEGQPHAALICLILAGLADLFDGFLARRAKGRTPLQAEVGKHLDSIVDLGSFGFVPVVFAYCYGLRSPVEVVILLAFLAAAATRLAYFNSTGLEASEDGSACFLGMPVTYTALFVPLTFASSFVLDAATERLVLAGLYLALALAMVAGFRLRKPGGRWYAFFASSALALLGLYSWAILTG